MRSTHLPSRHRRSDDVDGFTAHRFTFPVMGVCTLMGMLASGSMLPRVSITGFYRSLYQSTTHAVEFGSDACFQLVEN